MKIKIHPIFFAVGIFCCLFGGLTEFIICTLTALLHECGHIFYAYKTGYECKNVKLMPYGAAAVCDLEGISTADEIKLALSGPLVNAAICVAVAGLWWFYPETYAYTDTVMSANTAMLFINLLPAYPLDGGRVLSCAIKKFSSVKAAEITVKIIGSVTGLIFIALFFLFYKNVSLLFMAMFLFASVFEKRPPASKIKFAEHKNLKRGMEIKYVMASDEITYKQALKHSDSSKYLVLQISYDGFLEEVTEEELFEKLQTASVYDKIINKEDRV